MVAFMMVGGDPRTVILAIFIEVDEGGACWGVDSIVVDERWGCACVDGEVGVEREKEEVVREVGKGC